MSGAQSTKRVPVAGWLLGGLAVVSVGLLLVPSRKQKEFNMAKQRLETVYACPETVKKQIQSGALIESRIMNSPSTPVVAAGTPDNYPKPGDGTGVESKSRQITIWNPSSTRPLDSNVIDIPMLGNIGVPVSLIGPESEFPGRSVVVAPVDNHQDQEILALALIIWLKDPYMGKQLDDWRAHFIDSSKRAGAVAHMKRALVKCPATELAAARSTLEANRKLCAELPHGVRIHVDSNNRYFWVRDSFDYRFLADYQKVFWN